MPYCIYDKNKNPLQIYDFYEDAAMEAAEIDGAYVKEISDGETDYIENDISDYSYFKNNYGEDEDDLDFERSWGPNEDEVDECLTEEVESEAPKYIVKVYDEEGKCFWEEEFYTKEEANDAIQEQYDNWFFDDNNIAEAFIFPILSAAEHDDWEQIGNDFIITNGDIDESLTEGQQAPAAPKKATKWAIQYYNGKEEITTNFDKAVEQAETKSQIQNIWPEDGDYPSWTEEEGLFDLVDGEVKSAYSDSGSKSLQEILKEQAEVLGYDSIENPKPYTFKEFKGMMVDYVTEALEIEGLDNITISEKDITSDLYKVYLNYYNGEEVDESLNEDYEDIVDQIIDNYSNAVYYHGQELAEEGEYNSAEEFVDEYYQLINVERVNNGYELTMDRPLSNNDQEEAAQIITYAFDLDVAAITDDIFSEGGIVSTPNEPTIYVEDWVIEDKLLNEDYNQSAPKVGDTIRIIHLKGEDNSYDGRTGVIEEIDGIGQLHGTWGGLAVIPEEDEFEIITTGSLNEAKKGEDELPPDPEAVKLDVHNNLNNLVADEISTINEYEEAKSEIIDAPIEHKDELINTIDHIKDEEKEHIDELINATSEIPFAKTTSDTPIAEPAVEPAADEDEDEDEWEDEGIKESLNEDWEDNIAKADELLKKLIAETDNEDYSDEDGYWSGDGEWCYRYLYSYILKFNNKEKLEQLINEYSKEIPGVTFYCVDPELYGDYDFNDPDFDEDEIDWDNGLPGEIGYIIIEDEDIEESIASDKTKNNSIKEELEGGDTPLPIIDNIIKIVGRDLLCDLAESLWDGNSYGGRDDDEALEYLVSDIIDYYKMNNKNFCDFLEDLDSDYTAKYYEEDFSRKIKKAEYYINHYGNDYTEFMIPLFACYYYDKPGTYILDFSNRQDRSSCKAKIKIEPNHSYDIISIKED